MPMGPIISEFFRSNWYWFVIFAVMAAAMYLMLRLQVMLRDSTAAMVSQLLAADPRLCLERLENNRRLSLLFRKNVLLLWKLDCCLALGEDGKARSLIKTLRDRKLEPLDKVELYQKEISFFATSGDGERAKQAYSDLKAFLKEAGAEKDKHYHAIAEEAGLIIGIYVDRNVGLIKKLISRAEHTGNDILRGVTQYRVAKLAWFKGDEELMRTYLTRAAKNLQGTHYAPVIAAAFQDPTILETK